MDSDTFCFGPFRLIAAERLLLKDDTPFALGTRKFDLLLALVERAGEAVSRRDLFERVWPDVIVEEVNLRVQIAQLRKALRDGRNGARFIVSVSGRGYCFVAPVRRLARQVTTLSTEEIATERPATRLQRMIGRHSIVATLSSQLLSKRFIGLSGPGGMGRTTVAVAVAHSLAADFGEAICVVDLGTVENPSRVVHAIASALGCHTDLRDPLSGLLAFLAEKEMLLVLDSCERVIETVAELTERLFNEAPLVHVLTTSRSALHAHSMSMFLGVRDGFAFAREDS
jgi:DNA-binding winged helix-turn-helix (wHTH) protein